MDVLVMGATGNVGGALVQLLRARGVRVHAITRKARRWPDDVQGVVGDANAPASLAGAAAGMDGAFLMSGYPAEAQLLADLGTGHAALLSSSSVPLADGGNAMAAYHRDSEAAVKASDGPWTIVRPCSMQSNVTRWKDQLDAGDVIRAPFGDVAVAMTDPADVAAVVATALTERGHAGQTYRLSGPELRIRHPAHSAAGSRSSGGEPARLVGAQPHAPSLRRIQTAAPPERTRPRSVRSHGGISS
jgi:uncharacterized protein YbjT (DUF2867 family)